TRHRSAPSYCANGKETTMFRRSLIAFSCTLAALALPASLVPLGLTSLSAAPAARASATTLYRAPNGVDSSFGRFTVVRGSLSPNLALDPNSGMIRGNAEEQPSSRVPATSDAGSCPISWSCADIGTPFPRGNESLTNDTWTVQGSGDIWGSADHFHFDWQTLGGDGVVTARVLSQSNSDPWAKAGVMLRGGSDRGAPFYAALVTPGHGIIVQYRSAQGVAARSVSSQPGSAPVYLQAARLGNSFSAYMSSDGIHWTLLPRSTVTIGSLRGPLSAGLATTSHKNGRLSTAIFDAITVGAL
ncbi:MAG: hypothetical protein ACRDG4_10420, partial [Chloroflexota bacterium]